MYLMQVSPEVKALCTDGLVHMYDICGNRITNVPFSNVGSTLPVDVLSLVYSQTGSELAYDIAGEYGKVNTLLTASEVMNSVDKLPGLIFVATERGTISGMTYTHIMYCYSFKCITKDMIGAIL